MICSIYLAATLYAQGTFHQMDALYKELSPATPYEITLTCEVTP